MDFKMLVSVLLVSFPLRTIAIDFEVEPNDISIDASLIHSGQVVQGNIGAATDVDYYRYTSSASSLIRIYMDRTIQNYAYNIGKIRVLDSNSIELASVDIYAPDGHTTFDIGAEIDETYYIEVTGCPETNTGSACFWARSQIYTFSIVQLPNPTFESEQNGSIGTADIVPLNAWIFGQHSDMLDVDYYRFEVPTAGNLFAHVTRSPDGYKYSLGNVAIVAEDDTLLNSHDIYAPDGRGRVVLGLKEPGSYFIKLTSCKENNGRCELTHSDPYQIALSFTPASKCDVIFKDGFESCPTE
jgi:hypothetical protein